MRDTELSEAEERDEIESYRRNVETNRKRQQEWEEFTRKHPPPSVIRTSLCLRIVDVILELLTTSIV